MTKTSDQVESVALFLRCMVEITMTERLPESATDG
jgi:hypothetical protein